jgi:uncharacterized protein YkwD
MISTTVLFLSFFMPLAAEPDAASKTPQNTPPAAAQDAAASKEKAPVAAKDDSRAAESAAENKQGTEKKTEAEKKAKDLELHPIEASVISMTNTQREKYGLPPLKVDKDLMQTARKHCGWMTRNRIFQHGRFGVAENIAMGQHDSQDVLRAWMNSSGHRANILNPGHHRIGVSAYRTKDGTIYWCQQFRN